MIERKEFGSAIEAAAAARQTGTGKNTELANLLEAAAVRMSASTAVTLQSIKADLDSGDLYLAKCRLSALAPILPAGDRRCEEWLRLIDDPSNARILECGRQFHETRRFEKSESNSFAENYVFNKRSRGILVGLSKNEQAGSYREMAKKLLAELKE